MELTAGIIIAAVFLILWWIRRASRRPYTQKQIRQLSPGILKEFLSHADRINDYFTKAVKVWIFAHEESARKAALSAAKVAADLQRQSMVNYLLAMSTDLSKEMGDEAAPICRLLQQLATEICEKDWTVADALVDRLELAKIDKEFADALDRADPGIFEKRYPHLWATVGKYKKHSDEAMGRKASAEISKMKSEAIDKMAKSMLVSYAIGKEIMFKSKGLPEDEVFKGLLEDIKVICKRENVPDEWSIEVTQAFERMVEEYRSMDEKHSTEMIKLIMKELESARGMVSEESR